MGNKFVIPARPKIAELSFQLFGRALHPELFEIHRSRTFHRENYSVRLDITSTGHLVSWQGNNLTLSEVAVSSQHPLPEQRRIFSNPLRGEHSDDIECRGGVRYRCGYQLETVDSKLFWNYQKQITENSTGEGLLHCFDSNGRISLGAISYIHLVSRAKSVIVRAFHTFPDDFVIVKTQSEFTLPS